MPRRIDLGRILLIAGAAVLLVSLFVEWYDTGQTGWEVFEALDLILAGLAIAAVIVGLNAEDVPRWLPWTIPAAAVAIVLVQLIDAPPAVGADASPTTGAWLALGGSIIMLLGGGLSLSTVSVTVNVRDRDLQRRVAAVDRRAERDDLRPSTEPDEEEPLEPRRTESLLRRDEGPAARAGETADVERTEPLSALDDDEEEKKPRRPRRSREEPAGS
jgi:hypothetical protein